MVLELNSTNSVKTLKLNYHYNRAPMIAQLVKNLAATQPTRIITINHNNQNQKSMSIKWNRDATELRQTQYS